MYRGVITAPGTAESEIRKAGFSIYKMRDTITQGVVDFIVEGPESALDAIDNNWGAWVWSLRDKDDKDGELC